MKKVVRTESHILNISESVKNSDKCKAHIEKIQNENKKPVINNNTKEIFSSAKDAALFYGIRYESLTQGIRRNSSTNIFSYV
jgi:hypothetical protein